MTQNRKWKRGEAVRIFEILIENNCDLISSPRVRNRLNRDENLLANQFTREANGNIAYRSVDFKIEDEMTDEVFWTKIRQTPYADMIEENATVALLKMAEKLKLLE